MKGHTYGGRSFPVPATDVMAVVAPFYANFRGRSWVYDRAVLWVHSPTRPTTRLARRICRCSPRGDVQRRLSRLVPSPTQ